MEIGQLEAFVEVARQGSVSRAAESLFLTQPSVTRRLQTLEEELGEDLFTRLQYGITLTDAGKTLLPYAQRALRTLDDGRVALENLREAMAGDLILATGSLISTYLLPVLLERFGVEHPKVRVAVSTAHSEGVLAMVLNEEVQIGLIRNLKHPDVEATKLYDDELLLVVNPDHPFSRRQSVTIQEVVDEGLVLLDRPTSYYGLMNDVFFQAGVARKPKLRLQSLEAAKKMVERGLGIAVLPTIAIGQELAAGTLKAVPIADSPYVKLEMVAIYRKAGGLGGIARAFLETIGELPNLLPAVPVFERAGKA